jgi:Na+-transporting NADH:ubiquinone oxidoreductase subunit NqrC
MKKLRTVLIVLSAIYIVLTIIFLLNSDSLFNSFNLLKLIDYLQAWIVVSLLLLTGVIIAGSLYIRNLNSRYKKLDTEYNKVKARVYDIEQERKAEIAQRRVEEEATEQKLGAFNKSLKEKDRPASDENDPTQSSQS